MKKGPSKGRGDLAKWLSGYKWGQQPHTYMDKKMLRALNGCLEVPSSHSQCSTAVQSSPYRLSEDPETLTEPKRHLEIKGHQESLADARNEALKARGEPEPDAQGVPIGTRRPFRFSIAI